MYCIPPHFVQALWLAPVTASSHLKSLSERAVCPLAVFILAFLILLFSIYTNWVRLGIKSRKRIMKQAIYSMHLTAQSLEELVDMQKEYGAVLQTDS